MGRCLLFLWLLLFADALLLGNLEEKTSLGVLREAGIPQESFQEAGISSEDALLYVEFWEDLEYFPLAFPCSRKEEFFFENGWHDKRNYGGERLHEGCDIFGSQSISGYYPVVSITDGIVEQVGWLQFGRRIFLLCPSFFLWPEVYRGRKDKCRRTVGIPGRQRIWNRRNDRKIPPSSPSGNLCADGKGRRVCPESLSGTEVLTGKAENFFLLKRKKICYTFKI